MTTPLLILSDAPTSGTGLGRITRDLATRIHANLSDVFEVATIGYAGPYSKALGFHQYSLEMKDWVCFNLPEVWKDFAGDRHGIVMTIWDASRMLWFARPENCESRKLRTFLEKPPFDRWGYFPMDATGPNDKLVDILSHTIDGYDRVLAYSKWAVGILERSLNPEDLDLDWRPHGIDPTMFYPRHRIQARHGFGQRIGARNNKGKPLSIPDDALMVGIVATNQMRKDWGLGIQAVAEMAKERKVFLWCHIDVLERHWSLPALIHAFEIPLDNVVVTNLELTDEQMAWCYSACDVTLGIGLGEGFGYPIFESLACGTPCIHGNYGGAAEHLPDEMLIHPNDCPIETLYRLEGPYCCYRPVYDPRDWAEKALNVAKTDATLPPGLDWNNLWPCWEEWFRKGVK